MMVATLAIIPGLALDAIAPQMVKHTQQRVRLLIVHACDAVRAGSRRCL